MTEDNEDVGSDFCPTCGDPTIADSHRRATLNEVREILAPVIDWFESDERDGIPTLEILRDVVKELQNDRAYGLLAADALRKFLSACTCDMIHHWGMGPAFDAAQKAKAFECSTHSPDAQETR